MSNGNNTKLHEEQKRDRALTAQQRWEFAQAAIKFAEENMPAKFRRNVPRRPTDPNEKAYK